MSRARGIAASAAAIAILAGCASTPGAPTPDASATASQSHAAATATPTAGPTKPPVGVPTATTVSGVKATSLRLGYGTAPIDIAYAFGSIWVANHHSDDVVRLDPKTLQEIARIKIGPAAGPGWFAVTDNAVWVSNQNAKGVTRIDPTTNTASKPLGNKPPCGPLTVAGGMVWQFACDFHRYVRFDAKTNAVSEVTEGHGDLIANAGRLFAGGDEGLLELNPVTGAVLRKISATGGHPSGMDASSVWLSDDQQVVRVDIATGKELGRLSLVNAGYTEATSDRLWLPQENHGVYEIDLTTYQTLRTVEILSFPAKALEAAGYLWVTEFDTSTLWRLEP